MSRNVKFGMEFDYGRWYISCIDNFCDFRLEADVKRLKTDLQSSRQLEQDLRSQINTLISGEKSIKSELTQLQQDNDDLQSKWVVKVKNSLYFSYVLKYTVLCSFRTNKNSAIID